MKQLHHATLAIAFAAVLATAGIAIAATAYAQRAEIAIAEQVLYGDASAATGMSITQYTTMDNRLVWQTTTPLANAAASVSTLRQTRSYQTADTQTEGSFDVGFGLNMSGSTNGSFDFTDETTALQCGYPSALFQAMASRVQAGSTHTAQVRVADYGDYYTPSIHILFPSEVGGGWYYQTEGSDPLAEYLRVPVGKDDTATITMSANQDGGIYELSAELTTASKATPDYMRAVFDGTTAYLARRMGDDIEIHRLVFTPTEGEAGRASSDFTLASASLVYTLAGKQLAGNQLSLRDGLLFVMTGDDFVEEIIVLSLPDMQVLQTLRTDSIHAQDITHYDGFFAMTDGMGGFAIYEKDATGEHATAGTAAGTTSNGSAAASATNAAPYHLAMVGDYSDYLPVTDLYPYQPSMQYQDGTLLIALRDCYGDSLTSFVSVHTLGAGGCVFAAAYTPSLAQDGLRQSANPQNTNHQLRNWEMQPIEICWPAT